MEGAMSRAPLVRSLTHQQQMLAEQAMLVIDNAIHAFWRRHASLRRYRPVIDSRSTAMVAVTLASFNFNPLRSKATTYYTVAIHNALRKVALREKRRVEVPAHSKAQYGVDKKAIQPSWGSATECMETLDPQTRQLVHDSVVVGRQITEIARGVGRDPRTLQRRLDAALTLLRDCVSSSQPDAPLGSLDS